MSSRRIPGETDPQFAARLAWIERGEQLRAEHQARCSVYLLQYGEHGLIKIGSSANVERRMKAIQANCPLPLRLLGWVSGGQAAEFAFHKRFASARSHGEWFFPTAELLACAMTDLNHDVPPVIEWPAELNTHLWRTA